MAIDNFEILAIIISQIVLQIILHLKGNADVRSSIKRMESSSNFRGSDDMASNIHALADKISNLIVERTLPERNREHEIPKRKRELEDGLSERSSSGGSGGDQSKTP